MDSLGRSTRLGKRVRSDELFFEEPDKGISGSYLKIKLSSGKAFKSKGWPWVQTGVRGVLGTTERLEKASFLNDGCLLIKTKTNIQTDKFLKVKKFANEECEVIRDQKLNQSRGTIQAYDLLDLSEDEVVGWLGEFGVIQAKRFTKKVRGQTENTPTILLTFDSPTCPQKLQLDYATYHVRQYIPNPMQCHKCGRFSHPEAGCRNDQACLHCGKTDHVADCSHPAWCINCKQTGHSCLSRECAIWLKEKEICKIKTEQDMSYSQARKHYDQTHQAPPILNSYATVTRTYSSVRKNEDELTKRVGMLEKRVGELITVLEKMVNLPGTLSGMADKGESIVREEPRDVTTGPEEINDLNMGDGNSLGDGEMTVTPTPGGVVQQSQSSDSDKVDNTAGQGLPNGKKKRKNKPSNSEPGDVFSPSPILTRHAKQTDRTEPQHSGLRQCWKTNTE